MFIVALFEVAPNWRQHPSWQDRCSAEYSQWDTMLSSDGNKPQLHPAGWMNLTSNGEGNNTDKQKNMRFQFYKVQTLQK